MVNIKVSGYTFGSVCFNAAVFYMLVSKDKADVTDASLSPSHQPADMLML